MRSLVSTTLFALSATLGVTALSACVGFEPMHATSAGQATFSDLALDVGSGSDENDRLAGFLIEKRLEDRISTSASPKYRLVVTPGSQRIGIGLTGQDFATRFDGVVTARWRLIQRSDGKQIASGQARSVATYSADRDPYRLQVTSDQATERAARVVADELIQQVSLELAQIKPTSQP
ncbi:MAG: hypothetical protein AAFP97_04125 [Pseudomonadota bacterium]